MLNKSIKLPDSSMEKQCVNDILKVRFYRKNNIKKEDETVKRQLRNIIVSAVALSMIIPAIAAPELQAASKPKLSTTKVSVKVGKTKKVTVKGVKTKKIKKTSWSVKSKKIATLSKKKKNSVTIKGKKAGSTKLTAKIKVGKKTYTKKCTVKVTGADTKVTPTPAPTNGGTTPTPPSGVTPTPSTAPTDTPTPALRQLDQSYKDAKAPEPISKDFLATTPPNPTVDPATALVYEDNFEDLAVGTKTEMEGEKAVDTTAECKYGLNRWILRGFEEGGPTGKDYLEIVSASDVPASNHDDYKNEGSGNVLKCHRDPASKSWQGPMLNLTGIVEPGATYYVDVWAYAEAAILDFNEQVKASEFTEDSYAFMPTRITATKWKSTQGLWSHFKYSITVPDDMYYYGFYFQNDNGAVGDIYVDRMTITKTGVVAQDKSLPKIKDTYSDVFGIVSTAAGAGEILGPSSMEFITDQFNAVTAGNELKPESILNDEFITIDEAKAKGFYVPEGLAGNEDNKKDDVVQVPDLDFTLVDKILEACHEKGLKFRGHTLCWHEQTSTYFFQKGWSTVKSASRNTSKENMDLRLEYFVKSTLKHILEKDLELAGGDKSKCVLYAYDVVNEYLHSGNASSNERGSGTFYHSIYNTIDGNTTSGVTLQPSYVKDAFTWADQMLKECGREDVKLFYNDFNCYLAPEDIVHLIDFINSDGQVCDGLGMQTHLTVGDSAHSADNYARALECFRLNMPDMEIHVTEWDAGQGSGDDLDQAVYYDQIAGTIMQSKKKGGKITAIVIWGLKDGTSWRASNKPLLFNGLFSPKAAFYSFIDAKARYWS